MLSALLYTPHPNIQETKPNLSCLCFVWLFLRNHFCRISFLCHSISISSLLRYFNCQARLGLTFSALLFHNLTLLPFFSFPSVGDIPYDLLLVEIWNIPHWTTALIFWFQKLFLGIVSAPYSYNNLLYRSQWQNMFSFLSCKFGLYFYLIVNLLMPIHNLGYVNLNGITPGKSQTFWTIPCMVQNQYNCSLYK